MPYHNVKSVDQSINQSIDQNTFLYIVSISPYSL